MGPLMTVWRKPRTDRSMPLHLICERSIFPARGHHQRACGLHWLTYPIAPVRRLWVFPVAAGSGGGIFQGLSLAVGGESLTLIPPST